MNGYPRITSSSSKFVFSTVVQWLAVLLFMLATTSADAVSVSGSVQWRDSVDMLHPVRGGVALFVFEENPALGSTFVGEFVTELDGTFELEFDLRPGASGYAVVPLSRNSAAEIRVPTTTTVYTLGGGFRFLTDPVAPINFIAPSDAGAGGAFGILDAMYTSWAWNVDADPGGPAPMPVFAEFPEIMLPSTGYVHDVNTIFILAADGVDFDIVNHEYGHAIAYRGKLAASQDVIGGLTHIFGGSNIIPHGKHIGARLGWSEGLANWSALAAQAERGPTGVPLVGDLNYDGTIDVVHSINIESPLGDPVFNAINDGEGDENSVMRILWDISDPANEPHDILARGHTAFLNDLLAMDLDPGLEHRGPHTLHEFWNTTTASISNVDKARLGAIFEANGVAPHSVLEDFSAGPGDEVTFVWNIMNGSNNDTFSILIFNLDMTTLLMEKAVSGSPSPGASSMEYLLPAADWAALVGMGGPFKYVITGADQNDFFTGMPYKMMSDFSGPYWGAAYDLSVAIPEPAGLLPLIAVMATWFCTALAREKPFL